MMKYRHIIFALSLMIVSPFSISQSQFNQAHEALEDRYQLALDQLEDKTRNINGTPASVGVGCMYPDIQSALDNGNSVIHMVVPWAGHLMQVRMK